MRVLFWGTPAFALPAFRALSEEGHDVVCVVTQPDRPAGRGRVLTPSPVKAAAVAEGIPVLQPERARGADFEAELRSLEPEISVVVAFGQILRPEILEVPRLGSVNIHASLLPELRGAAPIQWAIARGRETSGVSIMRMEAGLDSGPVLLQVPEPIRVDESAGELAARLAALGAEAIIATLVLLASGGVEEQPQRHELATYAPKLTRDAARVEWDRPAEQVSRWIRATDPAPGAWSHLDGGVPVKLFRPRVETGSGAPGQVLHADPDGGVLIAAGEAAVRIHEVQPTGKRRMSAAEWVRGRGVAGGMRFV